MERDVDQSKLLPVDVGFFFFFFCRNFDEVLSSFVEPLLESTSFSESCSGLYEEENFKVRAGLCQSHWLICKKTVVIGVSAATDLSSVHYRIRETTQSTSLMCP